MKRIICFSGGDGSGITAIEVKRRYPNDEVILLNHDISLEVEESDIKRFKKEVADYLGLPIWYANYNDKTHTQKMQYALIITKRFHFLSISKPSIRIRM